MGYKLVSAGADPELFVIDKEYGEIVPVTGLVGGTKTEPKDVGDGFFVQEDNVLLEFNIPPSYSEDEFVKNVMEGVKRAKMQLPEPYGVVNKAYHQFQHGSLLEESECELGCEPDFNAYLGTMNEAPDPDGDFRTSAGHIAAGYEDHDPEKNKTIVKSMDLHLAVPGVLLDDDNQRRRLYGKAGAYRDKPWGLEYRTLSSFWVDSEGLIRWAYKGTEKALEEADLIESLDDYTLALIQDVINNYDKKGAEVLCKKFNIEYQVA